jgi:acyl-CoA thioesterase FadM
MSYLEIAKPNKIHFTTELKTRYSDSRSAFVSSGIVVSHVTYENIALLVNEAFDLFLEYFSYSKANIAGSNIIVSALELSYHAELQANQKIIAEISVTDMGTKSFSLIVFLNKEDGTIAAKGRISLIFYNYKLKKTEPIPEEFRRKFE